MHSGTDSMGVHQHRPPRRPRLVHPPGSIEPREVPVDLDLARADLYRLLDELARATRERHGDLVRAFERAWEAYKERTASRLP
jgi:hypothetical protein